MKNVMKQEKPASSLLPSLQRSPGAFTSAAKPQKDEGRGSLVCRFYPFSQARGSEVFLREEPILFLLCLIFLRY
jgi:hypothetical protein